MERARREGDPTRHRRSERLQGHLRIITDDDLLSVFTAPRARFPRGFAYGAFGGARLGLRAAFDYWWSDGYAGIAWAS